MKQYLPWAIACLLLLALLKQCNSLRQTTSRAEANLNVLTDSLRYYQNRLGTVTASASMLQMEKNDFRNIILQKDRDLKQLAAGFVKIKSMNRYDSRATIDSIPIKFDAPIVSTGVDSLARFERRGIVSNKWYSLAYTVTNDSLIISPFTTWTQTTVLTGTKRKWFLGRQTVTTDITNSNPYIQVTDSKAAEIILPEPWYKKWYVWLAAGMAGGLLLK